MGPRQALRQLGGRMTRHVQDLVAAFSIALVCALVAFNLGRAQVLADHDRCPPRSDLRGAFP
jgi:hypothetical protein